MHRNKACLRVELAHFIENLLEPARAFAAIAVFGAGLSACASSGPYQIELMSVPSVFEDAVIDPFANSDTAGSERDLDILYATDRQPHTEQGEASYYTNERGYVLRLGSAQVQYFGHATSMQDARRASLMKRRAGEFSLSVRGVEEFGVLEDSLTVFDEREFSVQEYQESARRLVSLIDARLERSNSKDVFIYVHGYNINFENPILVAAELWHFLGYQGAMVSYAWPATENVFAYASDVETAQMSARNLRILLTVLARESRARYIHILGYSAGTRVVTEALAQLALLHAAKDTATVHGRLRIGQVLLIGSDIDRDLLENYLADGLLKVPAHLSIYLSNTDSALGLSSWVFQRKRLGQVFTKEETTPRVVKYLRDTENLAIVDVTKAERAEAGNGHWYFRDSPWVSSDVLVTLRYQLSPGERGLIRSKDWPIWRFPVDYISRLRTSLFEKNRKGSTSSRGDLGGLSAKLE